MADKNKKQANKLVADRNQAQSEKFIQVCKFAFVYICLCLLHFKICKWRIQLQTKVRKIMCVGIQTYVYIFIGHI